CSEESVGMMRDDGVREVVFRAAASPPPHLGGASGGCSDTPPKIKRGEPPARLAPLLDELVRAAVTL
ncbi:MAG: hypothetical protein ACREMB_20380, partial [Candidatus Rokuibacteriota bacterium]